MTGGPMKPIQVVPPGLMGLLQLKQTGRLPDELMDQVRPVVELRDWYMTARSLDANTLFGAFPSVVLATGNEGALTFKIAGNPVGVPAGQMWYVHTYSCNGIGAATTDVLNIAVAHDNGLGNQIFQDGPTQFDVVSARTRFYSARADHGFWVFPGDRFLILVHDVLSAGITLFMDIRATPLPL